MNKLAITTLCLFGWMQASCIIVNEGGGNDGDTGAFNVTWSLDPGCPSEASVRINATNVDSGVVFSDVYDCIVGGGLAADLPLGDYDVSLEVLSGDLSRLFATSEVRAMRLQSLGQQEFIDFPNLPLAQGSFIMTWALLQGGAEITCASVGANAVQMDAMAVDGATAMLIGLFECEARSGESYPLYAGDYSVFINMYSDNDPTALASSDVQIASIVADTQFADLGNFDFVFVP